MYILLCLTFFICARIGGTEAQGVFHCQGKDSIEKVDFLKSCGKSITVTSALAVTALEHTYIKVIPNCLKCKLKFVAEEDYHLTATFHTFGTETGPQGKCNLNRVDVFNGETTDKSQLLSNKTGICGCDLPHEVFKSSSDSLTLTLTTVCDNSTVQHGEFEIIISAVKIDPVANITRCSGQFECGDEKCIDKNLVCNGKSDCKDNSDEKGCKKRPEPNKNPLWLYVLVGVSVLCLVVLVVIMSLLCYRYCCQFKMAKAYERFK